MPVQGRQRGRERRRITRQLTLFETRSAQPRWGDLEPPTRMEVVTTLATVLAEHVGQNHDGGEASDE
jgi:hypothetical protein